MLSNIDIPEPVRRKARAAGAIGETWLTDLASSVENLATAWRLSLGQTLTGGSEAFVAEVTTFDGRAAVLKIIPPWLAAATGEIDVMQAAQGRGYADLYTADPAAGAMLLERLGPTLASLDRSIDQQIVSICTTLAEAWTIPPVGFSAMSGAAKARSLGEFIHATWHELHQPCSALVIDTALRYAEERRQRFDPRAAVLAHGDAHAWNMLLVPGSVPERFKLIDPDGLFIERAYDLAIPMREWTDELLAGDPLARGAARCQRLAELAGSEPEPIWQWGYIERVSTGLLCLQLGLQAGHSMLAVAERWAEVG